MTEKVTEVVNWLEDSAADAMGMETGDRQMLNEAAAMLKAMKIAMHEIDRECNKVRTNYRQGSQEEIIASTIKAQVRPFVKGDY